MARPHNVSTFFLYIVSQVYASHTDSKYVYLATTHKTVVQ